MQGIVIKGLRKAFDGVAVICGFDLTISRGERHLFIGPNGSGKSTLFNILAGEIRADAGEVLLDGAPLVGPPWKRARRGLARSFQTTMLFDGRTAESNLLMARMSSSGGWWKPFSATDAHITLEVRKIIERVGLGDLAGRHIGEMSYGERRRLDLAMAMVQKPRLLLLDEPFAGLSYDERQIVLAAIKAIPTDVTLMMVEHDLDIVPQLADRVSLVQEGRVVVSGSYSDIAGDPRAREVYFA
jgi:branched-chain amino acid transport system ATP-binding protein